MILQYMRFIYYYLGLSLFEGKELDMCSLFSFTSAFSWSVSDRAIAILERLRELRGLLQAEFAS